MNDTPSPKPKKPKRQRKHSAEIIDLGPHPRMTPDQALAVAAKRPYKHVLVIGIEEDESVDIIHSLITPKDVVWMTEIARQSVFGGYLDLDIE